MRTAVLGPLKEVYGVSDKILMMALSVLFLGAPGRRHRWLKVGGSMIAVDTLVHNFLHRTGILHRFRADHAYGLACYRPGGCAEIIENRRRADRRQAVQPAVSTDIPAVRSIRDLAILLPARSRHLQRQSDR
jgi:hypothetical protein